MDDTRRWSRTPHDRKRSLSDFLFTSHDGLSVVVISGECFLAGDVTHVVNCKWWPIGEQPVVCHVSPPRHGKNLRLFNRLIWHSDHFNRQKYLVVWPRRKGMWASGERSYGTDSTLVPHFESSQLIICNHSSHLLTDTCILSSCKNSTSVFK